MSKMTLLEIVQNIASAIDSDEVNSINDTVESTQISLVVKETFYEMFGNLKIPEHKKFIQLSSLADPDRPNYLKMEDEIHKIDWIKYQDASRDNYFYDVTYLIPDDFVKVILDNQVITPVPLVFNPTTGPEFPAVTGRFPTYCTSFDDVHIVFDSYDATIETTVQSSKALCYGQVIPTFELTDDFIPWIDANLFPLLLAEAKSTCFINLKQVSSAKEEQKVKRQRMRWQNDTFKQGNYKLRLPDYGRHR